MQRLGIRVYGLGLRVWVLGLGLRVFRVQGQMDYDMKNEMEDEGKLALYRGFWREPEISRIQTVFCTNHSGGTRLGEGHDNPPKKKRA